MSVEEAAFEALDEAAVAGANGACWEIPDIGAVVSSPVDIHYWSASPQFDSLSNSFLTSEVKREPVAVEFPISPISPDAASLCSVPLSAVARRSDDACQSSSDSTGAQDKLSIVSSETLENQETDTASVNVKRRNSYSKKLQKAKEELEYGLFSPADLKGTTAARSRKMSEEERRIMLHKRRLRNRASAARSREKRCKTITDLTTEVEELLRTTSELSSKCSSLGVEVKRLQADNKALQKENSRLKSARFS